MFWRLHKQIRQGRFIKQAFFLLIIMPMRVQLLASGKSRPYHKISSSCVLPVVPLILSASYRAPVRLLNIPTRQHPLDKLRHGRVHHN